MPIAALPSGAAEAQAIDVVKQLAFVPVLRVPGLVEIGTGEIDHRQVSF